MPNVITRGFANVARFNGRDTRGEFWPYCGAAVALYLVVGWALLIPIMLPVFNASPPAAGAFQDTIGHFLLVSVLMFGVLVALLAGAVARRLHDSGLSAFLGLVPLPFVAYSGTMFFRFSSQFGSSTPIDTRLFFSVFFSNLVYMICVVTLVVLLARRSSPTANRYG